MFGRKLPRTRLIWIAATIVAVLAVSGGAFVALRSSIDTVPFSTFLQDVEANRVRAVRVEGDTFAFERRDGTRFETLAPEAYIASTPSFVPGLVARGVRFDVGRSAAPSGSSAALAFTLLASGLARVLRLPPAALGPRADASRSCRPSIPKASPSPSATWPAWTRRRTKCGRSWTS